MTAAVSDPPAPRPFAFAAMSDDPPPSPSSSAVRPLSDADRAGRSKLSGPESKLGCLLAYRLLLLLATATLALDQATKLWVVTHIPLDRLHSHDVGQDIEVIPHFFYLIHVRNTGAAWSMLAGQGGLLAVLAAGTLAAMFFWRHTLGLRDRANQYAFGLLCGGIAGNLLDRLARGEVTDFVDLHFGSYIYPTFNVADSGICVGVCLYLIRSLRSPQGCQKS